MSPPSEPPRGERVDPRSAGRPGASELRGPRVLLRPVDPSRDAPALFAGAHGDRAIETLWTYLPYGPFENEQVLQAWLVERAASKDPLFLTVVEHAQELAVGMVSFMRIEETHRCLELGNIWYGTNHQRGVANPEAVYLMLCEAFDRLGYRRVEWKCDALNERSRKAALRLGFTFEGIFRKHFIIKGRNRDTAWFSLLEEEWPAAKSALEAWLTSRS